MSTEKTTKAYKVDPDVRSKVEELFQQSGVTTEGDFLDHMASVYAMHLAKAGTGYEKQIASLEYHTKSIIEGVLSMLHTEAAERVKLSEGFEQKLTERAASVWEQEQQIRELSVELEQLKKAGVDYGTQINGYQRQVQQLHIGNERAEQLLSEYRERIETLSGILAENQKTVDAAGHVRAKLDEWVSVATQNARERDAVRAELEAVQKEHDQAIAALSASHTWEIENVQLRSDLAKDKAVLAAKREAQDLLEAERAAHNEQVRTLYEELDKVRRQLVEAQQPKPIKPRQPGR